jgi:hypothetical protein
MARLIVEKGHEKGRSIPLAARTTTVFGRDTTANVQIKDTMASRAHFKIEPRADGLWLVDLQSMNGTLLNGHPVRESRLNPGDLIRVGETLYSFVSDDEGADPLIGQRLGGYKILERVGRGGMGTVYKAEQVDLQRIVALKIISEEHLKNPEFIELFVHEARAAAKLNHPNIVQVYDVKKANELYYFSMEFVPGGSVQDLLNNRRKVPIPDAVRMILQAARGLEYAHRKEIIHRDVKPDNFMIGEGDSIKIGDLGLAQRLGEKLTADNEDSVIGTPHYIAPEQVLGRPADVRSDVYSLGSTMYRMIAGFTPFQAPSIRDLVNRKAREDAIPLHSALASIPESLSRICAKMMARLPEQRTQTMTEVIADLEGWTRAGSGDTAEPRETQPVHRKLLITAVGLLAIVVVGGVIAAKAMLKPDAPVVREPDQPALESGDPESKFDRAAAEESRLDDRKPDDFEGVIRMYDAIISRWPGTPYARDAERRMEDLKKRRVALMANRGLAALDDLDRETWKGLLQGFQAGREDVAEAERRFREYRAFAEDPAWKGTEAAAAAKKRAETITSWQTEVEKRRAGYGKLRETTEKLASEQRYREAWEACNDFVSDIASYPAASKDRYTTLLYDVPARRLQEKIVDHALKSFETAAEQAAALEAKGEFAKAVELLEASVRHSLKDPVDRAKKLLEEVHKRWSAANRKAAELATLEQRKLADLDRRDFDAAAKRWHEAVLRFDPKSALADGQGHSKASPDGFPRLPASQSRLAARLTPLLILAEFKEKLIRALNEKPAQVPNRLTLEKRTGTIIKASETHLTLDFGGGVQIEHSFADLLSGALGSSKTAQFLDYLRAAGKNADARWSMGLAALCLELGLYERALEDLRAIEKSPDDAARKFVAEMKPMAEDLRYLDSDEIEAQKHYDRLLLALKDPPAAPRFDVARTLQILRTRYGETEFFAAQKSKIDEIEKDRADRDVKEREKTVRAEKYRKIFAAQAEAMSESKGREAAITRGIAQLKDPIERSYHLGESQGGFGNLTGSTKALLDALDTGFRRFPPPERRNYTDPNSVMVWVARSGAGLLRNFHLQKQEARAADIRSKVDAKFSDAKFLPWEWYKDAYDQWTPQVAERIKKHGDKLALLEKELQENPDPKVLYDLAEAQDILRNALEARGLYAALISEYADHEKVKSGDALLRLAENTFQLRDVAKAEELYQRMKADYPAHPKVVQNMAYDSVDNRLRWCNSLKNNMGLAK